MTNTSASLHIHTLFVRVEWLNKQYLQRVGQGPISGYCIGPKVFNCIFHVFFYHAVVLIASIEDCIYVKKKFIV